ncbi:MAG: PPC domain-containing protein, partial [Elusimicrobia bacterium]|nr:PPC domain-containing protein [Elusimicrobiota bacterium]
IAVDYGQNQAAPSAPASVAPGGTASGGTISGGVFPYTVTVSGTYRLRLYNSPNGAFLAENNQNPFSFSNLSSGTYYLKGFRDLDENGERGAFEPAGTAGGLHQNPFPIFISGANSPFVDVTLCDRALLQVGPSVSGSLSSGGCPALDAGPNRRTNPLAFEAGTGEAGSISTGTALAISMTRITSGGVLHGSRLIVIGPSGQIIAANDSPDGASVSFTPVEFGVYVVEPTSQWELSNGTYSVTMSAGASGEATEGISGTVSYAGTQGGANVVRFFANSSFSGIPLATFTVSGSGGPFDQRYLPAGDYTVDAYRDTAGVGFNANVQAYGQCNGGAPISHPGGTVTAIGGVCTLLDPQSGTAGTSSLSGAILYNGGVTGTVRIGLYPYGSNVPARVSSAAFSAGTPFAFGAIGSGSYLLKSFVDANDNFIPDPNEPVVTSTSTGFFLETGASRSGANFTLCDRSPIVPGSPVTFPLSAVCPAPERAGSYMKLYTFNGASGQPVTLQANAVNFSDSYLYLYDPNGNLIAVDDDGGGSYNAKLSDFPLPMNGAYTVGAGPYGSDINGQLELSVTLSGGALGSIAGDVDYAGTQGGAIQVGLFDSPDFSS